MSSVMLHAEIFSQSGHWESTEHWSQMVRLAVCENCFSQTRHTLGRQPIIAVECQYLILNYKDSLTADAVHALVSCCAQHLDQLAPALLCCSRNMTTHHKPLRILLCSHCRGRQLARQPSCGCLPSTCTQTCVCIPLLGQQLGLDLMV